MIWLFHWQISGRRLSLRKRGWSKRGRCIAVVSLFFLPAEPLDSRDQHPFTRWVDAQGLWDCLGLLLPASVGVVLCGLNRVTVPSSRPHLFIICSLEMNETVITCRMVELAYWWYIMIRYNHNIWLNIIFPCASGTCLSVISLVYSQFLSIYLLFLL